VCCGGCGVTGRSPPNREEHSWPGCPSSIEKVDQCLFHIWRFGVEEGPLDESVMLSQEQLCCCSDHCCGVLPSGPSSTTASHPNIGSNAPVVVPAKSISKSLGKIQSLSAGSMLFKTSRHRLAAPYPANQIASNVFVLSTSAFHPEQSGDCESVRMQMTGIEVAWNRK